MKVRPAAATLLFPLLLVLAACAETPVDPGDGGGIDHATTPDHVLVRISSEGGFTPVEWTYTNFPVYSLFGDGTLVVPGAQIAIYPGPALPGDLQPTGRRGRDPGDPRGRRSRPWRTSPPISTISDT